MRKILLTVLLVITAATLFAGEIYMVPKYNPSRAENDKAPSICVNRQGDQLVMYRNAYTGIMWYFKKSGSTTWVGPAPVPNQPTNFINVISNTETVATSDNKFHVVWDGWGVHYAVFDPAAQTWTTPERIVVGTSEAPRLRLSKSGDVCLAYVLFLGTKDIYWKNLTKGTTTRVSSGIYSETNPDFTFDAEGYMYLTYKEDRVPYTGVDEFLIQMIVYDPNYTEIFRDEITWYYWGWRMLPTVAAVKGKGVNIHASNKEGQYMCMPFGRSGNTITFDYYGLKPLVPAPMVPWFWFFSRVIPHGDKLYWFFMSVDFNIQLMRFKDGAWIDTTPITITPTMQVNWPFFPFSTSQGIWIAFYNRFEPYNTYFTLYEAQLILPAINVEHQHLIGGSLYTRYYMDLVTWEDNPDNAETNIVVDKFRIYHRDTSVTNSSWVLDGEVNPDIHQFAVKNVPAADVYEYGVACVDDSGNESSPADVNPSVRTPRKNERTVE